MRRRIEMRDFFVVGARTEDAALVTGEELRHRNVYPADTVKKILPDEGLNSSEPHLLRHLVAVSRKHAQRRLGGGAYGTDSFGQIFYQRRQAQHDARTHNHRGKRQDGERNANHGRNNIKHSQPLSII